ncbi:caprin homolog [Anthonomus grandis grandis]|uniref:caprin homolog n=1 Tax=Anthonomus grandis grandis TaxID=2921223 RepID=UPI002165629B|nr:caprin homolog [Anthonomus grandis grandis]
MPSAANVKIDKQISSSENALADNGNTATTPIRQAVTIIEHKIRNLEKRKSKLESYRDLQNAGKELNSDQKTALAKINEVIMTLDFARDLYKQFLGIASSSEKDAKKQAKREAALKSQAELARLREILLVQDALNQMGNEIVRNDFLNGRNGAAQLTEADLKLLDDLYPAVTPKHESGNPTAFTNEVQAAAEHLLAVVDGKAKDVFGGTYSQIKEILGKIHESGYFDQSPVEAIVEEETVEVVTDTVAVAALEPELPVQVCNDGALAGQIETITIEATNHPTIHGGGQRIPPVLPVEQPPVPIVPAAGVPLQAPPQGVPPTVVPAPLVMDPTATIPPPHQPPPPPQEIFYQPQPPHQPPRPITEMLGTGNFFFLQESEIDTPEQIPTQTFTNQTFVGQPPPPPIPMPPHHYQGPPQISPNNLSPQMQNHQVPLAAVPVVQPVPASMQPVINEDVSLVKPIPPPQSEEMDKHSMNRASQNRGPVPASNHQPQSFYNNGYTNRPSRPSAQQHSRNNGVPQNHQGRPQPNRH